MDVIQNLEEISRLILIEPSHFTYKETVVPRSRICSRSWRSGWGGCEPSFVPSPQHFPWLSASPRGCAWASSQTPSRAACSAGGGEGVIRVGVTLVWPRNQGAWSRKAHLLQSIHSNTLAGKGDPAQSSTSGPLPLDSRFTTCSCGRWGSLPTTASDHCLSAVQPAVSKLPDPTPGPGRSHQASETRAVFSGFCEIYVSPSRWLWRSRHRPATGISEAFPRTQLMTSGS